MLFLVRAQAVLYTFQSKPVVKRINKSLMILNSLWLCHTAKTQYRKLETSIPRKVIVLPPNFNIHVSGSDLYIPTIGLPILLQENIWADPRNI